MTTKKPNYALKAKVLRSDLPRYANLIEHAIYAHDILAVTGEVIETKLSYDTAIELRGFLISKYPTEYAEAEKLNKAYYKRIKRLRVRIHDIISNYAQPTFLTLTFSDDTLAKTSESTRRKYIDRYLHSQGDVYVANIDYGKTNGREHYHAVINARVNPSNWEQYGFIFAEPVFASYSKLPACYSNLTEEEKQLKLLEANEKRLAKYVSKLTNHAIKETTKRSHLIYSRNGATYKPAPLPHRLSTFQINARACREFLEGAVELI